MRRSRIAPATFAAALLIFLIAALWFFFSLESAPPVAKAPALPAQAAAPLDQREPAPLLDEAVPPGPRVRDESLVWSASSADTPGYPDERVRLRRPEAIPPDELYSQNRLILRQIGVTTGRQGMQISGEVLTDFFSDRGPVGLPQGPLLGLKVNVELYHWDCVVARDAATHAPRDVHIDPQRLGSLVEGQSVQVATHILRGEFVVASFALPALSKPLPPGIYRLVASLRFKVQDVNLRDAIRWCSDLYGARSEWDDAAPEVRFRSVLADRSLHEEVYDFLINTVGTLQDEARIDVGQVVDSRTIGLVSPDLATAHRPANIVIYDYHYAIAEQVRGLEYQLDNVEQEVQKHLDAKLKTQLRKDAPEEDEREHRERKEKWKKEAEEDKKRIRRDNRALISRLGGRLTGAEHQMLERAKAARASVLAQIAEFQDRLALQYWILCDGVLQYAGWNSLYQPGYVACEAIQRGRLPAAPPELRLQGAELAAKWARRHEQWKYTPRELTAIAFEYLRTKEETDIWAPANFTIASDKGLTLDIGKWRQMRADWLAEFTAATAGQWAPVVTTRLYAVQVWPQALEQINAMRDEALLLAWAWEFYIRTEPQGEPAATVIADWVDAPEHLKERLATEATVPPGKVKTRFDTAGAELRRTFMRDFISRWSKAVAEGRTPPGRE
jgi:hypothetical protein